MLPTAALLVKLALLCHINISDANKSKSTYLFDLDLDPYESTNVLLSSSYNADISKLISLHDAWDEVYQSIDGAPTELMTETWDECGSVCPWLEDDDDFVPLSTNQIYSYDDAPHIVFLLVDDWGWNDVGFRSTYQSWATPNIDKLAAEGVKLENYYSHVSSLPSRGALLTGRYSIRLDLDRDKSSYDQVSELSLSEDTIAQEMKSAGYRTYMIGKWELGVSTPMHLPTNRGFDYFYGNIGDSIDPYTKLSSNGHLDLYKDEVLVTNEVELETSLHYALLLEIKAEDIIIRHSEEYSDVPMFLYYSMPLLNMDLGIPLVPEDYLLQCPQVGTTSLSSDTRNYMRAHCGLNVMLDAIIGNLTCTLRSYDMHNNTIMIISSSNGGSGFFEGMNYPYHGYKGDAYRGALSVTSIIHGNLVPSDAIGSSYYGQVHVTDWLPTLMSLATNNQWNGNIAGSVVDGESLWIDIVTNSTSKHLDMIHYYNGDDESISMQYNMLKYNVDTKYQSKSHDAQFFFTAHSGSYIDASCTDVSLLNDNYVDDDYLIYNTTYLLYDLSIDPYEQVDVSGDIGYSSRLQELVAIADDWQAYVGDSILPSEKLKKNTWSDAKGISTWLDDDDDFVAVSTDQIYSYDDAPHIVFVLVDDWGWNDVGVRSTYQSWATPNIDRLATEGVSLTNHLSHSTCIPSRGALLTGRYSIRLGLWGFHEGASLPLSETTVAQEMKSAGYKTYMVGKWHLGYSSANYLPNSRGFDYHYGFWNGHVDYWNKTYSGYLDLHENYDLVTDQDALDSRYHNGYLLQSKVEEVIANHSSNYPDDPMFLYYSLQLVHADWTAPQIFLDRCGYPTDESLDDSFRDVLYNYCGMNVMLDEAIGNLTCAIQSAGMADNTIVFLVSDNGGEETIVGGNFPYKGSKGSTFKGGIASTALIHSPLISDLMIGQTYTGMLHITDWLPTMMGLATNWQWSGLLSGYPLDGMDQWDTIMSNATSKRTTYVNYADGISASSIQYMQLKLEVAATEPMVQSVAYVFESDLHPEYASYTCSNRSLMTYTKPNYTNADGGVADSTADTDTASDETDRYINSSIKVGFLVLSVITVSIISCIIARDQRKEFSLNEYDAIGHVADEAATYSSRDRGDTATATDRDSSDPSESTRLL